ncbi:MAG TPA: hypothetical protein PLD53_10240 [Candidatus Propionivibrio aalborgensis]|nr:hypothetical protein [Candidatus Propionivibrio aalborgensis]
MTDEALLATLSPSHGLVPASARAWVPGRHEFRRILVLPGAAGCNAGADVLGTAAAGVALQRWAR